jgi:cobalt-zinc-cadmium efflux system membrane fusion protein
MMKNITIIRLLTASTIVAILALAPVAVALDDHDHDHVVTDSVGEASDHDDSEAHADELVVELTPEAVAMADISIGHVSRGRIAKTIELPGEVGFNEDRLVHIAPRFAGIAIQTSCRVGDFVDSGTTVAVVESNESMNAYTIGAPISGWVIERHITPGEFVSEENSIYVIADLSLVWVNLAVYPGDADRIRKGQDVYLSAIGSDMRSTGTVDYVTPIMDVATRSITARVVLSNRNNEWRPGTFVKGTVVTGAGDEGLVVDRDAVQYFDEEAVVFVVDGTNRFKAVEVVTGDYDEKNIRILSGLEEGTEYVTHGAFELKAKIITSAMDGHAGHGH